MKHRRCGRIGGIAPVPAERDAAEAVRAALGPGGQLLGADGGFDVIADWDACSVDDRPMLALADWGAVVREGRLAQVAGAFALAWREPDGTVGLARDAIGERTIYFGATADGSRLVFASTLRAVLASGLVPRLLHLPSVARYLACAYVPGPATLICGVTELEPGEILRWRRGAIERARLWDMPAETGGDSDGGGSDDGGSDAPARAGACAARLEADLSRKLRRALEAAVARRLPTGEPVGATLSGGLDSSLVAALARRLHDGPVHTYSIHFGAGHANELHWSGLVAGELGTQHRVLELSPAAILGDLDRTIALLSDPIGDPLTVPNALVFRHAAREVGVVLNGEGGDPCFGGPKNLPMILAALLGDGAGEPDEGSGADAESLSSEERRRTARSYLRAHGKCYDDLGAMLGADVRDALRADPPESFLVPLLADPRWYRFVSRLQAMNVKLKGAYHILHKVDEVSAPADVLPRSPLFDRDVVELALAIPPELKLRGSVEKYLLKRSVADLLPAAIIARPKSGMLVPVEGWFRGELLPHARERILDGLRPYRLFEERWLERLLAGRLGGLRPRHGAKIWLLVTLEAWLRTNVPGG